MTASFFDPAALRTRLREQPSLDVPFLVVLLALLSYGLIMLFSAGYAVALYRRGDAYTYIRPQLLFAALGAAAMYAASLVDYHVWHKLAWPVMGLSLILLGIGWNFGFTGASAKIIDFHRPEEKTQVQSLNDFLVFGVMIVGSFSSGVLLNAFGWNAVLWGSLVPVAVALLTLLLRPLSPPRA